MKVVSIMPAVGWWVRWTKEGSCDQVCPLVAWAVTHEGRVVGLQTWDDQHVDDVDIYNNEMEGTYEYTPPGYPTPEGYITEEENGNG